MGSQDTLGAIEAAEAEAKAQQKRIEELKQQRVSEIQNDIAENDKSVTAITAANAALTEELSSLTGAPVKKSRKGKGTSKPRAKGQKPLTHFIAKALNGRKRGLKVSDLIVKVLELGYETSSDNLGPMVAQALRKGPFVKLHRGIYAVEAAPAE